MSAEHAQVLTPEALQFLATLHRCFNARRRALLAARAARQSRLDAGELPDFLPHTAAVRADPSWRGASPAPGLVDRRVEITGPVDRKMVINALNCGAKTFMADFEDSSAPTWANLLDGHVNLRDALKRTISLQSKGKTYSLKPEPQLATLLVRPRGWHMEEAHVLVDGEPTSASLFDFGLFFFHNARQALAIGHGPYFYLPKMESHLEARLWNDVFCVSQDYVGLPRGTIRATVLIETILAAFEMEEILFELREHSAGLNCGRWDYIFSFIKKFRNRPDMVLPDRSAVTMVRRGLGRTRVPLAVGGSPAVPAANRKKKTNPSPPAAQKPTSPPHPTPPTPNPNTQKQTTPFMSAYVRLLIQTCHRRGVHAMGGMAAQIPIKDDAAANANALAKVRADKEREALAGHDGTWVAHPALVPIAMEVFDRVMPQPNQLFVRREDVVVRQADLLSREGLGGAPTEEGLRNNLNVALQYMESWLR